MTDYRPPMPLVAILGSVLLLLVVFIRPSKRASVAVFAGVIVVALFSVPALLGFIADRPSAIFPNALSEQLMRSVLPVLERASDEQPDHLLLFEGASWSSRGIDGTLLEDELSRLGYSVVVAQATLPGANYFERDFILNQLSSSLSGEQIDKLNSLDMILIRELSPDYLNNPIAQLDRNLYTDRVYAYSSPRRARDMNQAATDTGRASPRRTVALAQHAAFNWLRIGEAERLDREQHRETLQGYWPLDATKADMHTHAIAEIISFIESDEQPEFDTPPWIDILNRMDQHNYGFPIDSTVFIQLPTLRLSTSQYARWFATQTEDSVITIDDSGLYEDLQDVSLWHDTGHLRREGAEIYTRWLANRIGTLLDAGA